MNYNEIMQICKEKERERTKMVEMEIPIPPSKERRLKSRISGINLQGDIYQKRQKLIDCMLYHQYLLLALRPSSRVPALYEKTRLRFNTTDKDNKQKSGALKYKRQVPEEYYTKISSPFISRIIAEVNFARCRLKSGQTGLAEYKIDDQLLIAKMIVEEIDLLTKSSKNKGYRKYFQSELTTIVKEKIVRSDYELSLFDKDTGNKIIANLHEKEKLLDKNKYTTRFQEVLRLCNIEKNFPEIQKAINDYKLDINYLIYYFLLAANHSIEQTNTTDLDYILKTVTERLQEIEQLTKSARENITLLDNTDIAYKVYEDEAAILSLVIRTALREEEEPTEEELEADEREREEYIKAGKDPKDLDKYPTTAVIRDIIAKIRKGHSYEPKKNTIKLNYEYTFNDYSDGDWKRHKLAYVKINDKKYENCSSFQAYLETVKFVLDMKPELAAQLVEKRRQRIEWADIAMAMEEKRKQEEEEKRKKEEEKKRKEQQQDNDEQEKPLKWIPKWIIPKWIPVEGHNVALNCRLDISAIVKLMQFVLDEAQLPYDTVKFSFEK